MKKIAVLLISIILFNASSCNKDDATSPEDGIQKLTITHWGVDFSEGKVGSRDSEVAYDKSDGESISWCAYGSSNSGTTGIWYRPYVEKLKRLSTTDLSSTSLADTTNWSSDVCSTPLQSGQVWIAKCRDGYVAFRVTKQPDVNLEFWPVEVEYKYFKK